MAQTVHLKLRIAGNDIQGESTIASLGRADTIECSSFSCGLMTPYDKTTMALTGKALREPVEIVKGIDKTTPLLLKALHQQEPVDRAEFRFFRPAVTGAGDEEHFLTVLLEGGYIVSVTQLSEDPTVGGEAAPPMMEEVAFLFKYITWTYMIGGVEFRAFWR
jgi:type VI secretion system secreted protein Hcp